MRKAGWIGLVLCGLACGGCGGAGANAGMAGTAGMSTGGAGGAGTGGAGTAVRDGGSSPDGPAAAPWEIHPTPVYGDWAFDMRQSFTGDPCVAYFNGRFYNWNATLLPFALGTAMGTFGASIDQASAATPATICDSLPVNALVKICSLPLELSTSTDGIHWARFDNGTPDLGDDYVLIRDSAESWDSASVEAPTVVVDGSTLKMWFNASKRLACEKDPACIGDIMCRARCLGDRMGTFKLGYAESSDGTHWHKYDDPTTTSPEFAASDPVFGARPGAWDDGFVVDPTVLKEGGVYKLWYGAYGIAADKVQIGYAESNDGKTGWRRRDAPVLSPTQRRVGSPAPA